MTLRPAPADRDRVMAVDEPPGTAARRDALQVVVASANPVKHEAARRGLERCFPGRPIKLEGVALPSGVDDQPRSDEETLAGARNRAAAALHTVAQNVSRSLECFRKLIEA